MSESKDGRVLDSRPSSQYYSWAVALGCLARCTLGAQVLFGSLVFLTFLMAQLLPGTPAITQLVGVAGIHTTTTRSSLSTAPQLHPQPILMRNPPQPLPVDASAKLSSAHLPTSAASTHGFRIPQVPLTMLLIPAAVVLGACALWGRQLYRQHMETPSVAIYSTFGLKPEGPDSPPPVPSVFTAPEGPSSDFKVVWSRFLTLAAPFWKTETNPNARSAQLKLAGIVALSLATTAISVGFSFLGRDFFNYLSQKDVEGFWSQLRIYMVAIPCGIPFFVMRDYYSAQLKLEWRQWLTEYLLAQYLAERKFYRVQTESLVDNPDQRITSDIAQFTSTSLGFFFTIFSSLTDLVSFSGILYSIYPPLFIVLIVYSLGGTAISIRLGQPLVGLNFEQEKREANFRYSLVRVRENAESIAFFNGERSESEALRASLASAVDNIQKLLLTNRNLGFFTSYYQYLIGLLPAAVIAPLYFQGQVEFGVINQSSSAFNHILGDVSLVVFQFSAIAGFAAVIDRLGQFSEVLNNKDQQPAEGIKLIDSESPPHLLTATELSLTTPDKRRTLLKDLSLAVEEGQSVLLMGPSGSGKTSLLRAFAGLWSQGSGEVQRAVADPLQPYRDVFFVPQKPYMVLGTLRRQLLYPTWTEQSSSEVHIPCPTDAELEEVLKAVRLDGLLARLPGDVPPLDVECQWSSVLSLGEQQRISFARLLLARPRLAILDEASSALDLQNEDHLYRQVQERGITCISVGHRPSLQAFHQKLLYLKPDGTGGPAVLLKDPKLDMEAISAL